MMYDPNAIKKALAWLIFYIVVYSATLVGIGYWMASYSSEPTAPVRMQGDD